MLPLNLLLLPLIGGFVFVSRWHLSRFVVLRSEGYRLLFHSAVAGLTLLFLSAIVVFALTSAPPRLRLLVMATKFINSGWDKVVPEPYSGTVALALVLGCLLWKPLNFLVMPRNHQIDTVISRKEDCLEVLMRKALGLGQMVLFRLDSGDNYVGYVTSNFNPVFQTEYVKILPVLRGFTDKTSAELIFIESYAATYLDMRARHASAAIQEILCNKGREERYFQKWGFETGIWKYEVIIPIKDIKAASIYVPEVA